MSDPKLYVVVETGRTWLSPVSAYDIKELAQERVPGRVLDDGSPLRRVVPYVPARLTPEQVEAAIQAYHDGPDDHPGAIRYVLSVLGLELPEADDE